MPTLPAPMTSIGAGRACTHHGMQLEAITDVTAVADIATIAFIPFTVVSAHALMQAAQGMGRFCSYSRVDRNVCIGIFKAASKGAWNKQREGHRQAHRDRGADFSWF